MILGERFWNNVDKTHECWLWKGAMNRQGYGYCCPGNGKQMLAHRASYLHFNRGIPEGMVLDHLCGHKSCVNPLHLEAVTMQVNAIRARGKLSCTHRDRRGAPCTDCVETQVRLVQRIKSSGGSVGYYGNRKWRLGHPATRLAGKAKYYAQSRVAAISARKHWTRAEINRIISRDIPDRQLAQELGRSMQAIQVKRWRLP